MYRKLENTKTLKIIVFSLTLVVLSIFFTGCASVNYREYNIDDTFYAIEVIVTLDEEAGKYEITKETIQNHISAVMQEEMMNISNRYNANLQYMKQNAIIDEEAYTLLSSNEAFSVSGKWLGNTYNFALIVNAVSNENYYFSTSQILNIYTYASLIAPENPDSTDSNITLKKQLFTQIIEQVTTSPFSSESCKELENLFLENLKYAEDGYTLNDVTYMYEYVTNLKRLHSDGTVSYQDGIYLHSWNIEKDASGQVINDQITFYRVYTNPTSWHILGICISLVSLGIITLISYYSYKRKINKINIK